MSRYILAAFILIASSFIAQGQSVSDTTNQTDDKGRKTGFWKKYNESGMLIYEGNFLLDIPIGDFIYYYPDGEIRAKSIFSDNGTRVATTTFHLNGNKMTEGYYLHKQKDSLWRYYNIDNILLIEEYYQNNLKQGTWKVYFENGKTAEITSWNNDLQEGAWQQFFPDGTMKVDGNYFQGEKQGEIKYYFPSGKINIIGVYDMSYREGEWLYLDEDSTVVKKEIYEHGKLISEENY